MDECDIMQLSRRLRDIMMELDIIDSDHIEQRVTDILKGLQFTNIMLKQPVSYLSGGWRMRLTLAQALLCIQSIDLLLLDECNVL
jgi:ATPase subunit of ABC transporter with duplicated ATPase domains